jgi:hypothetical protein
MTEARPYDPQQLNLFHYARNNPLRFTDPTGEDIDDSSLSDNEEYQKWKKAFRNTAAGKAFWDKYSGDEYKVTIKIGDNSGGNGGAETIPTFDANGKLIGGTIVLGKNFASDAASSDYPIGRTLTSEVNDTSGHSQTPVEREARAVAFLAHEFGHLEDAERMGGAAWQREGDILQRNVDGFNRLKQPWFNTPEYKQLLSECGCNDPNILRTQREIRADGYTRGVLQDYYAKGAGHGSMPGRVKKAIQAYGKGHTR